MVKRNCKERWNIRYGFSISGGRKIVVLMKSDQTAKTKVQDRWQRFHRAVGLPAGRSWSTICKEEYSSIDLNRFLLLLTAVIRPLMSMT